MIYVNIQTGFEVQLDRLNEEESRFFKAAAKLFGLNTPASAVPTTSILSFASLTALSGLIASVPRFVAFAPV